MTRPRLLIRADAGPASGIGHVMRMLALAEAWTEAGGASSLLGRIPEALARRARAAGVDVAAALHEAGAAGDAASTAGVAKACGAVWIAADGYGFSTAWQSEVRAAARLLVVDDNAENAPYEADAVLNANAHATEAMYAQRAPHTRLLVGLPHLLLRSEFRRARREGDETAPVAGRWLVTMGGADPGDVTGRLLEAVNATGAKGFELELLVGAANPRAARYRELAARAAMPVTVTVDPDDVTVPMRRADLAFSASGGTVWELALLGVPSAIVITADNQAALGAALAARGAAEPLGDARTGTATDWVEGLLALSRDPQRRAHLVGSARALVDGEGARRVAQALREGIA